MNEEKYELSDPLRPVLIADDKYQTQDDRVKESIDIITSLSLTDQDDLKCLLPVAGFLPENCSPTSSTLNDESAIKVKKCVKFPDGVETKSCGPLVSLITPSTPLPTSHRRLHSDAVYTKFIEFLERGRPTRRFIREGLFGWRPRLFSSKKELVVHLFSDVICFSKKNVDGYLYLLQKCKLKECRAELEQMTLTITCGNSVMVITGAQEHIAKGWFNDIQALIVWCQNGEVGIMPVMASPDLEVAFASAHSRSISVALRQEFIAKTGIANKQTSHLRSTSVVPSQVDKQPRRTSIQRFEMSWEYAIDQMSLMRSAMKTAKYADLQDKDKQLRAERQNVAMAARLTALMAGDNLLKYDRSGNCHQRFYQVDPQGELLSWSKSKASISTSDKRLEMASLCNVVIGPQTKRFQRYLREGRRTPWLCFSLIPFAHNAHTIDLECNSPEQVVTAACTPNALLEKLSQFDCWVLGLQSLIPLWQSTHITHGHLLWIRTMMKLDWIGMQNKLRDRAETLRFIEAHPVPLDEYSHKEN